MDSQAKRPAEAKTFEAARDDDADWDVSTDVSPPSTGCGPRPTATGAES